MNNAFTVRELKFYYPNSQSPVVLCIEKLDIPASCITVFRGHNGSGKTTLLKILAGLYQPSSGCVQSCVSGRKVLVMQEPYLFRGTVRKNLLAPLKFMNLKTGGRENQLKEKLTLVGLDGFEKRKARELSGGERKRVAIARALMTDPELLLLDEPDANVDRSTSRELEKLILALREQGISVVLCSHHKGFAYRVADRIIDLHKGSPRRSDENVLKGRYTFQDGLYSEFETAGHRFRTPAREGRFSVMVIPPKSIVLSRDLSRDDRQSDRHEIPLKGRLERIETTREGESVLTLNCRNGLLLTSRLNETVLEMRNFSPGEELNIRINPSAVRLY